MCAGRRVRRLLAPIAWQVLLLANSLKRFCPEPQLPGWALPPVTLNLDSEMGSGEPSPTCLQVAPRRGEGTPGHTRAVARRASRTGSSEGWGAVAWSTLTSG